MVEKYSPKKPALSSTGRIDKAKAASSG